MLCGCERQKVCLSTASSPTFTFFIFLKTLFASSIMIINCADKNTEIKYSLNVKIMSSFKEVYDEQYLNNNIIFFMHGSSCVSHTTLLN